MVRLLLAASLVGCGAAPEPALPTPPTACFEQITRALADDSMEGRGVGTAGLKRAGDYLVSRLGEVLPGAHRQGFEATVGVTLGEENTLTSAGTPLRVGADFNPLGFSSVGAFDGELVFVGYGIRAEPLGYDDYAGADVRGKVVLALRYEPGEEDAESPFDGKRPSRWSDLRRKALVAREAGAAALVMVAAPRSADEPDRPPPLRTGGPTSDAGLPVLQTTWSTASAWLAKGGHDLAALRAEIDSKYAPRTVALPAVHLAGRVDLRQAVAAVHNVIGVLPGRGALAGETVVVGAHYDHLGFGGRGSFEPDTKAIHNGADDNASGVAAMLCGVDTLRTTLGDEARRTLVVVAFTAEEIGLGGSSWYTKNPARPMEDTVAMINLDMVGRVRDGKLQALGADSAPEWRARLAAAGEVSGLKVEGSGDGYGPSDQTPFYAAGVPVVHLFSGAHTDYHTPGDDAEALNFEGGGRVARMLAHLLESTLTGSRPTYVESTSGPAMAGDSRGYGAYLGTIPDYSAMTSAEGGVLLSGVRKGGPADRAGVRAKDRIRGMAGVEVRNLYDMTFVLRDHRPGETIEVLVERAGARHTLQATLGRRGKKGAAKPHHPTSQPWSPQAGEAAGALLDEREAHLADLRQLTFGGENAEAYFSPDGRKLVFQRTPAEGGCDQQYVLDLSTGETTQLSSGKGRTTCGYFAYPKGERLIYATTESGDAACPPPPDRSQGYVWPLYESFEMVWHAPGGEPRPFLPSPGYDAEATVCMRDGRVVFTSVRDGDLELYIANADGTGLRRFTKTPGYDGGAFFTPDCSEIVWRASRPKGKALADYRALLARNLVRPGALEIFIANADGGDVRQLTDNGAANFGPYPLPDASGVVFSSNVGASPREFDLHLVGRDGGATERITYAPGFDGFPMFSPDGRWLVFASNRGGTDHQTNLFIARWKP